MRKFSLIDEAWIPVLKNGKVEEVGLLQALLGAHTITRVETSSPLEEAALHRLLLAIVHRALMAPKDLWAALDLWEKGRLPEEAIGGYLEKYHERFFLFHPESPFFQIPDLAEDPPPLPWSKLLPELASGNNPTLFDHTTEENVPKASYAQVARALVVHQSFTTQGLLKRFGVASGRGAPLAGAASFLPTGQTLFHTLLLNLAPYPPEEAKEDAPIWEVPPLRLELIRDHRTRWPLSGTTRVYTWPSRGVRLLDEGDGVRFMAYGPGVEPVPTLFRDPMVAYRKTTGGDLLPLRLDVGRSFWRDFAAMLPAKGGVPPATLQHADEIRRGKDGSPWGLRILGQVSDQAKLLDVRREVYPLPGGLLNPKGELLLARALELAEDLGQGLGKLSSGLVRDILGERDPQGRRALSQSLPLERVYWFSLDGAFPLFLARLEEDGALAFWKVKVTEAALEAWNATRLFLGTEARHLKAVARGERVFAGLLAKLEEVKT
jgi:CRISPR system Cascade subunit CasA